MRSFADATTEAETVKLSQTQSSYFGECVEGVIAFASFARVIFRMLEANVPKIMRQGLSYGRELSRCAACLVRARVI